MTTRQNPEKGMGKATLETHLPAAQDRVFGPPTNLTSNFFERC